MCELLDSASQQGPRHITCRLPDTPLPALPPPPGSAVTLARLPDTSPALYRSQKVYPLTHEEPGLLLLRIDAPVFFANCVVRELAGLVYRFM